VRICALLAAATFTGLGCAGAVAHAHEHRSEAVAARSRGTLRVVTFHSAALRRRRSYLLYEPPGYAQAAAAGRRFPVLYLLHSAPGWPRRFVDAGRVDHYVDVAIAARRARPMLVVIPYGRVRLAPGGPDTEWANTRLGRYEDLVLDVVRDVDARFATIRSRRARVLAGPSTGGFAAANITLRHLATFSAFESWSGYFAETRTDAFTGESQANLTANSPVLYVPGLAAEIRRDPVWGISYQGSGDPEASGLSLFTRRLTRAGGHATAFRPPGGHGWSLWKAEEPRMLAWASQHEEGSAG
jgi:S-formylglutathione hydrolase FrmB